MKLNQGVIEGFFGREWSWTARKDMIDFIAQIGMSSYVYAPKSDRKLRTQWTQEWDLETLQNLQDLRLHAKSQKVQFGIALSPISLHQSITPEDTSIFQNKIQEIQKLNPDILCLCFDDMKADIPGLAQVQVDLCHLVQSWLPDVTLILCPSYYTFDPILEQVFGARPTDYWSTIRDNLDVKIGVFWTGPKVCSEDYPQAHLEEVKTILGDRLYLWDNYPVNDGRKLVDFLHLKAPRGRGPELAKHLQGQMINPMNQAYLSMIPLFAMSHGTSNFVTSGKSIETDDAIDFLINNSKLNQFLKLNFEEFQLDGLASMSDKQKEKLKIELIEIKAATSTRESDPKNLTNIEEQMLTEILDWLDNQYAFDPACLT